MEADSLVDSGIESCMDSDSVQSDSTQAESIVPPDSASGSSVRADTISAPASGDQPDSNEYDMDSDGGIEDIEAAVGQAMDVYSCLEHIHKFVDDLVEVQRYRQAYQVCADFLEYRYCIYCFMAKIYIINAHTVFYDTKHLFPECIRNFLEQSEKGQHAPLCFSETA